MFFGVYPMALAPAPTGVTTLPPYIHLVGQIIYISRGMEVYLTTGLCEALFVDEMQRTLPTV